MTTEAGNKRITVGIIGTRGIPNRHGGFERFVEQLVAHPRWADSEICYRIYGETESVADDTVVSRKLPFEKAQNGLRYYLVSTWWASRECDIILCCGVGISVFALLPALFGKTLIVNPDGCEWKRSKWSPLGRLLIWMMYFPAMLFARFIIIDAEGLRADFPRLFRPKMRVISYQAPKPVPAGNPDAVLKSFGIKRAFALIICRLEPENNLEMSIDGFVGAGLESYDLIIVGSMATQHYKDALAAKASPNVRFVGGIFDQPALNVLRQTCTAYLHGHTVGGTNPSLIEALVGVGGRIYCNDNKYNREVAGTRASYYVRATDLSRQLIDDLPANPGKPAMIPLGDFDDVRYDPDAIANSYAVLWGDACSS